MIKSKDNKKIKHVRCLNLKKNRMLHKEYLIESIKLISEALEANIDIQYILVNEHNVSDTGIENIIKVCNKNYIDYLVVKENIFKDVCNTISSQGIIAVVKMKVNNFDDSIKDKHMLVFCDRIQDPGNLGTIIRTANAFGPSTVILSNGCVDAYSPKVVRAAAGSLLRTPIINTTDFEDIYTNIKSNNYDVVSTVIDSEKSFNDIKLTNKICLVIGNEGQGISEEIKDKSDYSITIKMTGEVQSLNASVAAGICIYELREIIKKSCK